jgi:hypothetical protein
LWLSLAIKRRGQQDGGQQATTDTTFHS